jgi:hypothetical protein
VRWFDGGPAGRSKGGSDSVIKQSSCLQFRLKPRQCDKCANIASTLHVPRAYSGYYCDDCCPACKDTTAVKKGLTDVRETINKLGLLNALRKAGRRIRDGKSVDSVTLLKLIKALREHSPQICATLTDLIQAAQDEATRGDWFSALEHFGAAIELAGNPGLTPAECFPTSARWKSAAKGE